MSLTETVIEGTLHPDGTLALDTEPCLPAGRVRVYIQVAAPARGHGLADAIGDIWAGQQARGFAGRSAADLQAADDARAADDEDYEQRMAGIRAQTITGGPVPVP